MISLTTLSGRGLIAASLRDNRHNRFPEHNVKSDFISFTSELSLNAKDIRKILKKQKLDLDQTPNLVIEVYAFGSSGKFVLSMVTSDNPVADLLHGLPHQF